MLRYSVCTDAVFAHCSTIGAMNLAHHAGYRAIEFWSWEDKDLGGILAAKKELDMDIVAFCTRLVSLVDPFRQRDFIEGLEASIDAATRCGVGILIAQTGNDTGQPRPVQMRQMAQTLRRCAPLLARSGIQLAIEPLNLRVNHPGYFLSTMDDAAELIEQVGHDAVGLLFDCYHQQLSEGNLLRNLTQHLSKVVHMHAAGCPGRNELSLGEINYPWLLAAVEGLGYRGHVGLEYTPSQEPSKGLVDWRGAMEHPPA